MRARAPSFPFWPAGKPRSEGSAWLRREPGQRLTREALRMDTQERRIFGYLAQNKGYSSLSASNAVASLPLEPDGVKHSPLRG